MLDPMQTSLPKPRVFTFYVVAWTLLAGLALGYLALATLSPPSIARLHLPGFGPAPEDNRAEATTGNPPGASGARAATTTEIKADMKALAERVQALEATGAELRERLALIEQPLRDDKPMLKGPAETGSLVKPPSKPPFAPQSAVGQASALPSKPLPVPTDLTFELSPTQPRIINADASLPSDPTEKPGSSSRTPATPKAAAKSTAPAPAGFGQIEVRTAEKTTPAERTGPVGVQLGSGATLDMLRLNWSFLSEQNDGLRNLEARYTTSDALGSPAYRLQAGPLPSKDDANRVCAQLKAKGVACRVGTFVGEAL